jgi:hypothetical protein
MKRKMIDPPEGWRYGFPKEIPEDVDNTRKWLIENGYPEKEIEALGDYFFVRGWYEENCNGFCGEQECKENQANCKRIKK